MNSPIQLPHDSHHIYLITIHLFHRIIHLVCPCLLCISFCFVRLCCRLLLFPSWRWRTNIYSKCHKHSHEIPASLMRYTRNFRAAAAAASAFTVFQVTCLRLMRKTVCAKFQLFRSSNQLHYIKSHSKCTTANYTAKCVYVSSFIQILTVYAEISVCICVQHTAIRMLKWTEPESYANE